MLFVWLGYLVLAPLRYNQLDVFGATLRFQALFVAAAVAYAGHLAWHRRLPGPTRLDWAICGIIAAYGIAIALSIYPRFSLEAAFLIGALVLTFLLLSDIEDVTPPLMVRGLAGIGIAGAVLALVQVGEDYAGRLSLLSAVEGGIDAGDLLPPSVPRVHDVGDHVNMIALAFNLTLPFTLLLVLQGDRLERWVGGAGVAAIFLALFFTVSRGAWVSAAVAMPLFAVLYSRRETGVPSFSLPRVPRSALAAVAAAVALVLIAGAVVVAARWDSRPEWLFRSSLSPRYDAYEVALEIARDEPFTGAGPNTFSLLYNVYSGEYPIEDFHPHNGYLAVLVDAGVVGALAVGAAAVIVLLSVAATFRAGTPQTRALASACAAAFAALAVHSFLDMPNQSKTAMLLTVGVVVLALKVAPRPRVPARFAVGNIPRVAMLLFLPLFLAGWLWTNRGHSAYDDSLDALLVGEFDAGVRSALQAAERDPDFAAYHLHAGVLQAVDYLVQRDRGEPLPGMLDGAIVSLRHAVELEPRGAIARANLALAFRLKGDFDAAAAEARLALDRAPRDGTIAAVAGLVFESAGRWDEAINAYAQAVTHDASLIESPFWSSSAFRRETRTTVIERTFLTACQKARVVALYNRYTEDRLPDLAEACRTEVRSHPGDVRARSDLATALFRSASPDEAIGEARRAVDQAPDNAYARTALGFVLLDPDTIAEARRNLTLGADLGDPDALVLLAMSYESNSLSAGREVPEEALDEVARALPRAAPFVFDNGVQHYLLGILYYRPRYFRESPTTILIPCELTARLGEDPVLISPRVHALTRILRDAGRRP